MLRFRLRYGFLPRTFLGVAAALLTYLACESVASWLYLAGRLDPFVGRLYERTDPRGHIHRDPASGYRLSPTPARLTMFASDGRALSSGVLRGNNFGFADPRDFSLRRSSPDEKRFAVLGDSFTAGRFIEVNWPARAEESLTRRFQAPVRLYNLGIDGGGLGNWWRILRGFIDAQDLELDGVVFAVACDDLDRTFVWWDDSIAGEGYVSIHYEETWDASQDSILDAERLHSGNPTWRTVSTADYDAFLRGEWMPPLPARPFRLYFAHRLGSALARLLVPSASAEFRAPNTAREQALRLELLDAMGRLLRERRLPALVAAVSGTSLQQAREFAAAIGADYVAGGERSPELGDDESNWIPIDRHWSQAGSDRYAPDAARLIGDWIEKRR